ncbi:MAG: phosphomannomutase/phosphoglucomutase [Clostridia bacterium]|nr:phosphomannomutase/phosphoglucomutase [Clostridia bacterium]
MEISKNIFRGYDIRGIVPDEIDENVAKEIGKGFATLMKREGNTKIIVGRDARLSGDSLFNALCEGITSTGMDVVNIGHCMTPMTYFAREILNIKPSIMITASHNPKEYNGFKMCAMGRDTIFGEEIQEFRRFLEKEDFEVSEIPGKIIDHDLRETYISYIVDRVKLGDRKLKVAVDCGSGSAGWFAREFYSRLGVSEFFIECEEPDGNFPIHHPDPSQEKHMLKFEEFIRENKCDIGIAYDGDADRIICFDENGRINFGDEFMIIIWRDLIKNHPGADAILDVKCTQSLYEDLERIGAKPRFVKVGSSYIKADIRENNLIFAGEYAGHIYFNDEYFGFDDSFYSTARILKILSNTDKKYSELLDGITRYVGTPEKIVKVTDETKFDIVNKCTNYFKEKGYNVIDVDGSRVVYDGGWGLVRASNTGPNLTIKAEAITEEKCNDIMAEIEEAIKMFV